MINSFSTHRLLIEPVQLNHNPFIHELVNTPGWLKNIGDRNVNSPAEAIDYIQRLIDNPNVHYWVVKLKAPKVEIGVVTLIKRDYLEYQDIGFAFLPDFGNQGYAYEATIAIIEHIKLHANASYLLAISNPDNTSSIKLIEKIGFQFDKEIEIEDKKPFVFKMSIE